MDKKAKILVIDDEEGLRENLKYVLRMKGYDVQLAEDGVQGLKILETYTPDLIILDLNMPRMGGIEFYQKICEGDMPKYPVFVLTARANMEQFFKDFNVDGFMAKPFEIDELVNEVGGIIGKRAGQAVAAGSGGCRNIFIVDNDAAFLARAGAAFLMKGCTVNVAGSAADAIERISKNVPDAVCVKLDLADISGEIVIAKLKRMPKTAGIKCVLFASGMAEREIVTDTIRNKPGVDQFVIVHSEQDLIEAVALLR